MSHNIEKFKTFLYPAAFVLIAGFAFAYKLILKGNADFFVTTVRGGAEQAVTEVQSSAVQPSAASSDTSASGTGNSETDRTVQVYICGAVRSPGVYSVVRGTILNDAVEKAGGFREDAAVTSLNLVFEITGNMSFYIPTVKEIENGTAQDAGVIRGKGDYIWGPEGDASGTGAKGKVNINTADVAALKSLPGIGEATARTIIEYRKKTPFKTVSDLKKVSGIGDAKFEKVKAFITV